MDTLHEILEWVRLQSAPNSYHKYSRCPVCRQAWWDDKEQHSFDCWVPGAKKAAKRTPTGKQEVCVCQKDHDNEMVNGIWVCCDCSLPLAVKV